jgi:hypothetical protein
VMIIFGYKSKMTDGKTIEWAMLITYSFLVYIVNMKLLISIIGETYSKMQVSRVAMSYQITTGARLEIARFRFWERKESNHARKDENLQHLHWSVYKDSYGMINTQWPGMLKILVKNIKLVKKNVDDKQVSMIEHMKYIKEELKEEILDEVKNQFKEIKDIMQKHHEVKNESSK